MNLLIQGPPGVGKTTVIKKVAKILKNPAGFYTEEIRKAGTRVGFKVKSFEGKERVFAHKDYKSPYKVGKYKVNIEDFESVAIPALKDGLERREILLVDEIGKMEMFSQKFREKSKEALDSPILLVATVPQKITLQIKKLLEGRNFRTIKITKENRDELPLLIVNLLMVRKQDSYGET